MRSDGHAVESTCRVLTELGCPVAARTYRQWKTGMPAARTVSDAQALDAIRDVCWEHGADGVVRLRPEGLYGRRKLTAFFRRTSMPTIAQCTVVRAMKTLGHQGIRRTKTHRTTIPAKDGIRASDLLNRDWSAPAPT